MTPKEKAKEIYDKAYTFMDFDLEKDCALWAVGLLLDNLPDNLLDEQEEYKFWEEVKQEIEKL